MALNREVAETHVIGDHDEEKEVKRQMRKGWTDGSI